MDVCASCGAQLAGNLEWCPRCYAPVSRTEEPAAPAVRPGLAVRGLRMPVEPAPAPQFSRVRGGPTSMGWAGRLVASILLLVAGFLLYFYVFGLVLGFTGFKYLMLYLAAAGPAGLYLLSRLWRPTRIR